MTVNRSSVREQLNDLLAKLEGLCWEDEAFESRFGPQVKWLSKHVNALDDHPRRGADPRVTEAIHDLDRALHQLRERIRAI